MALTYFEERLYSSIQLMREVRFDTPLPQKWTDRPLYDWFRGAIGGIVMGAGDRSHCCSPAKVIHIAVPQDTGSVQWRRTADTLAVPVLVHEARHADPRPERLRARLPTDASAREVATGRLPRRRPAPPRTRV